MSRPPKGADKKVGHAPILTNRTSRVVEDELRAGKARTQCGKQIHIGHVFTLRTLVTCKSCLKELAAKGYRETDVWLDRALAPGTVAERANNPPRTWVKGADVAADLKRSVTQDRTDGRKVDVPVGATLQLQLRSCGKRTCRKCGGLRTVHGPYWYAYWRETTPGKFGGLTKDRLRVRYIGKQLFASVRARSRTLVTQDVKPGTLETRELFGGDDE